MIEQKIDNLNIAIHFDISVEDVAKLLNVTPDQVRQLVHRMQNIGDDTLLDELNKLDLAQLVKRAYEVGDHLYVEEVQA